MGAFFNKYLKSLRIFYVTNKELKAEEELRKKFEEEIRNKKKKRKKKKKKEKKNYKN